MNIDERLAQGTPVIMDGGTGTEIQRRGHRMDEAAWCGLAHLEDPALVQQVHEDYLRAGAEILIANTFATSKLVLDAAGHGDDFVAANRRAVEVARAARDAAATGPAWVAGSLSPMLPLDDLGSSEPQHGAEDDYRRQAEILAEAGADLLIAEMMLDVAGATPLVNGAARVGLPLWVGFSASRTDDGRLIGFQNPDGYLGEPTQDFDELLREVLALGGSVAGVMHSEVADTGPALAALARHWDGPAMAYAETGYFTRPYWVFAETLSPDAHADAVAAWVAEHGVTVVGGCCGTTPDHIRALRERLA